MQEVLVNTAAIVLWQVAKMVSQYGSKDVAHAGLFRSMLHVEKAEDPTCWF